MPLLNSEIQPGCYAWFEVEQLFADPLVHRTQTAAFRDGPFICVQEKNGHSVWVALTRQENASGRTWIKADWRLDGDQHWHAGDSYFNSLKETFVGPNASFLVAASNERPYAPHLRPRLSDVGVAFAMDRLKFNNARTL
jgi:hypothetical protein